ncbi:hypothetical protein GCM10027597_32070 [Saccharopolyspora tripterygii]
MSENNGVYTVGQAARLAGVTRKAIRVYESKGLLPPAERTEAGYRQFTEVDIASLRFVRHSRALGLCVDEIKDILDLQRGGNSPVPRWWPRSTGTKLASTGPSPTCTPCGTASPTFALKPKTNAAANRRRYAASSKPHRNRRSRVEAVGAQPCWQQRKTPRSRKARG